jgi:cytochrome c biogenesis protein ResB
MGRGKRCGELSRDAMLITLCMGVAIGVRWVYLGGVVSVIQLGEVMQEVV